MISSTPRRWPRAGGSPSWRRLRSRRAEPPRDDRCLVVVCHPGPITDQARLSADATKHRARELPRRHAAGRHERPRPEPASPQVDRGPLEPVKADTTLGVVRVTHWLEERGVEYELAAHPGTSRLWTSPGRRGCRLVTPGCIAPATRASSKPACRGSGGLVTRACCCLNGQHRPLARAITRSRPTWSITGFSRMHRGQAQRYGAIGER